MTLKEEERVVGMWKSGGYRQTTWRALFDLLGELDHTELRQKIEQILTQTGKASYRELGLPNWPSISA